jgi:hypothetical protein
LQQQRRKKEISLPVVSETQTTAPLMEKYSRSFYFGNTVMTKEDILPDNKSW